MDFFEAQDQAKSKTKSLLFLFALAVIGTGLALYVAVVMILHFTQQQPDYAARQPIDLLDWQLMGWVVGITAAVMLCASAFKVSSLSAGGSAVAEMVGGRRIGPNPTDPGEQRLRNVVEEMALASGVRMPEIFVLEREESINAFAAGYTLDNAAVAVSRGCLQQLDRDELQGVVAHEFSHILNGDMRINTRLVGIIFGILVLAVIGRVIFQITGRGAMHTRRSRDSKGGGAAAIVLIGLAVMVVGYVGALFGRLIQSAISRQREYLADAAAVQFTRNPSGISNALRKIGAFAHGSRIQHPDGQEMSHMFFANGIGKAFLGAFATHPPLDKRIAAIDPQGVYAKPLKVPAAKANPSPSPAKRPRADFVTSIAKDPAAAAAMASVILQSLPTDLAQRAREPRSAFGIIEACLDPANTGLIGHPLPSKERFALLELALAALKHLPPYELSEGIEALRRRALADKVITIDEQCLLVAAQRNLSDWNINADGKLVFFPTVKKEIETILSAIALIDAGTDQAAAEIAFAKAQAAFAPLGAQLTPNFHGAQDSDTLNNAIEEASRCVFAARKATIDGAARIAASDDQLSEREQTLIRSLCLALACPMPQ